MTDDDVDGDTVGDSEGVAEVEVDFVSSAVIVADADAVIVAVREGDDDTDAGGVPDGDGLAVAEYDGVNDGVKELVVDDDVDGDAAPVDETVTVGDPVAVADTLRDQVGVGDGDADADADDDPDRDGDTVVDGDADDEGDTDVE